MQDTHAIAIAKALHLILLELTKITSALQTIAKAQVSR